MRTDTKFVYATISTHELKEGGREITLDFLSKTRLSMAFLGGSSSGGSMSKGSLSRIGSSSIRVARAPSVGSMGLSHIRAAGERDMFSMGSSTMVHSHRVEKTAIILSLASSLLCRYLHKGNLLSFLPCAGSSSIEITTLSS
jgi:hypothetical protein